MATWIQRRAVIVSGAAAIVGRPVLGQGLQGRYIKMIVGFGAGGATDVLARLYAQKMQEVLGTTIITENRPGASQVVASRLVATAPPDGYTIMFSTGSGLAQGPGVIKGLPYDPLKSFSLIGEVATASAIFVVDPKLLIRSMAELIAYAKANPGKLNYSSAGTGSASYLQTVYLQQVTGIDIVHVPFRSDQELLQAVLAGQTQFALSVALPAVPFIEAGSLRALAVMGSQRLPGLPDVPTLAETGIAALHDIKDYTFYGLVGPAGMDPATIQKLNDAANQVSAMPDMVKQLRDVMFFEPVQSTPAGFREFLTAETAKWRAVGKTINLPPWGD